LPVELEQQSSSETRDRYEESMPELMAHQVALRSFPDLSAPCSGATAWSEHQPGISLA
jgi:hypothetical protein